jgi:cytochrome c-type biogenesis protein CcmE
MKKTHIVGIVLIAVAIAVVLTSYSDSSSYENFSYAQRHPDKVMHIIGELNQDKELHYNPIEDPNYFSFYLVDKAGNESKVIFRGTKPQDFERSEQVVLVGNMGKEAFEAKKILMKCPSKYQEDQIAVEAVSQN